MLGDPINRRLLACILHASEFVTVLHQQQHAKCRDVGSGSKWFLEQVHGVYLQHSFDVLTSLMTAAATTECGFSSSLGMAKAMSDEEVKAEDDFATTFGQLCHHNCVAWAKRWAVGLNCWDHEVYMCLDPSFRAEYVARFHRQYEQDAKLQAAVRPSMK